MSQEMADEIPVLLIGLAADPDIVAKEIENVSGEDFTYSQDEPGWARWSIETQMRHMANVPCHWLINQFGDSLRDKRYDLPDVDMKAISKAERQIPESVCPDADSLIAFMRPFFDLGVEILMRETPGSLREITCLRKVDPNLSRGVPPEKPVDFWRMASSLHPIGVREDAARGGFVIELGAALRQIHWEILAHTRTIQRIKNILKLPILSELPREGYLTMDRFYD
ncbi:MAG: hypothetical protein O2807_00055 [bacterium]|nr:hypothetical protein [bacterium]